MKVIGAGGTPGGIGSFLLGLVMMCAGFYLLLSSIVVTQSFGFGMSLYQVGPVGISSGMVLIPMVFGIGMIFFNGRSIGGWVLAVGALAALVIGVFVNTHFALRPMSLFDLLTILVLAVGGLGLFLRSLRSSPSRERESPGSRAP
jgi:hypothetical protein